MQEIIKYLKKYIIKIVLFTISIILLPMIIVHILFEFYYGIDFLVAKWSAGDALNYIATILSFIGTLVLGLFALVANKRANELSQQIAEIEQNRYKLELRPFVLLTDWKAYELSLDQIMFHPDRLYIQVGEYHDNGALGLALELTNTSNSCISIEYNGAYSEKFSWNHAAINQSKLKLNLKAGESGEIVFYTTHENLQKQIGHAIEINWILENRFSKRYKESFTFIITSLSNQVIHKEGEWFCSVHAQDYTIGRFETTKENDIVLVKEDL